MLKDNKHYKFVIFAIISILYMLVYFHRVSTNAIADNLIRDISINATQLGTISSAYFIFYAVLQPIIGILTDKLGAKKVILIFTSISILGCIGFGFSYDFITALISRSLIGIGVSGVFIPSLKLLAEWFSPERFARINGAFISIGHSGALIATTPLAFLSINYGWRNIFFMLAFMGLIMFLTTAFLLFDNNTAMSNINEKRERVRSRDAVKSLIKMKNFWLLVIIFFATFGAYVSFQGLWATKYLNCILGLTTAEANNIILFIPIGVIVGAMISGFLSDKFFYSRTIPLKIGLFLTLSSWIVITLSIKLISLTLLMLVFLLFGIGGGILLPLIFVIIKDKIHPSIVGTSMGLINPAYFAGIFVYQILTGVILDLNAVECEYTPHSYLVMMLFCLVSLLFTTIIGFFVEETFPDKKNKFI